ncbi:MAG: hypothetical protein ACFFCW_12155 [Candidatus Hodarchaeota archaeon]
MRKISEDASTNRQNGYSPHSVAMIALHSSSIPRKTAKVGAEKIVRQKKSCPVGNAQIVAVKAGF